MFPAYKLLLSRRCHARFIVPFSIELGVAVYPELVEGSHTASFNSIINMFTSETKIRVRYAETDQMDVVYHGNYTQYFEVGRAESIRQLGFTYKDMEAMGVIMPIVEWHAKFVRPAHYDDLITVKTMLKELPTDHRIEFYQEVYNEKGKLLTIGKAILYFIDAKTKTKTTMPVELRKKLEEFF